MFRAEYGLIENQMFLVYGKASLEGEVLIILPEFVIGCGTVDFEEAVERETNLISYQLNMMLLLLVLITVSHGILRALKK